MGCGPEGVGSVYHPQQTPHPHIHALVIEGVFRPKSGAFLPLPKLATEPFLRLWEQEVFALLRNP